MDGGAASARGHRGVRSCLGALGSGSGSGSGSGGGGGNRGGGFVRVGVGIGRCESRERGDVASFVLREMEARERERVEGAAGEVLRALEVIAEGVVDGG